MSCKVAFLTFIVIYAFSLRCTTAPTVSTALRIAVTDSLGVPVRGATVTLYYNKVDFLLSDSSFDASKTTDTLGTADFFIADHPYFWVAEKGCLSSSHFSSDTANYSLKKVQVNAINNVSCVMRNAGTFKLINNSADTCAVTIVGLVGNIVAGVAYPGDSVYLVKYVPVGTYNFTATQISGIVGSPLQKTMTAAMNCGDTLRFNFPN